MTSPLPSSASRWQEAFGEPGCRGTPQPFARRAGDAGPQAPAGVLPEVTRIWRALAVLLGALLVVSQPLPRASAQEDTASSAVFMVVVIEHAAGDTWKLVSYGTGFFITPEGRALTNSHVVYRAQRDPERESLLAVVGREFFGVRILCASRLPYDPSHRSFRGVPFGRDIAELQVVPSELPLAHWDQTVGGQRLTIARKHEGAMPRFPTLPLASGHSPGRGDHVRVIGYGHISPIPYQWEGSGVVDTEFRASDNTPLFSIQFTSPAQPGNSGSPVLNARGEVVGLYTWHSLTRSDLGVAQELSAVPSSCR